MILDVKFEESNTTFDCDFGEVNNISDGGYERGYDKGKQDGYSEGLIDGESIGYQKGVDKGNEALYHATDGNLQYMWSNATFPDGTDLVVHLKKITSMNFAFQHMKGIRSVTVISDDTSIVITAGGAFNGSKTLVFIDLTRSGCKFKGFSVEGANALKCIYGELDFSESTNLTNAFRYLYALEEIRLVPNSLKLSIDISWSTELSKASITSIVNGFSPYTSGLTLTLSREAVSNAFTMAEWGALVATKPNLTISLR